MRITARRNSRSFAAPQKNSRRKTGSPCRRSFAAQRTAFPQASALCIRPSHSLPALKIPLKIDPLCFMPAPDCAPRTARQNRASFRGPFPHFKRHGKRPVFTKSHPLLNAENDRRCRLRRIHSGKIFAPPCCTGRKISDISLCRRKTKVILFYFYRSVGACARFFSAFSQLSARISRAAFAASITRSFVEFS